MKSPVMSSDRSGRGMAGWEIITWLFVVAVAFWAIATLILSPGGKGAGPEGPGVALGTLHTG